jgi:hypothetical protein
MINKSKSRPEKHKKTENKTLSFLQVILWFSFLSCPSFPSSLPLVSPLATSLRLLRLRLHNLHLLQTLLSPLISDVKQPEYMHLGQKRGNK